MQTRMSIASNNASILDMADADSKEFKDFHEDYVLLKVVVEGGIAWRLSASYTDFDKIHRGPECGQLLLELEPRLMLIRE